MIRLDCRDGRHDACETCDCSCHAACHATHCDYSEPHSHGFACGPECLCGHGMQAGKRDAS